MFKIVVLSLLLASLGAPGADASCGTCATNGVACISQKQFQICINDQPQGELFNCTLATEVCTAYSDICIDTSLSSVTPACGDTSQCNACKDISAGGFACSSRNTYTRCFNNSAIAGLHTACPDSQLCDADVARQGEPPCVSVCLRDSRKLCDRLIPVDDDDVSTTLAPGVTAAPGTTTQSPQGNAFCAAKGIGGHYASPGDATCTRYIYCFIRENQWIGTTATCPNNGFFNPTTRSCGAQRAASCTA